MVLNLPRRYPHDMDGVADYIGRAFGTCRGLGHGTRYQIGLEMSATNKGWAIWFGRQQHLRFCSWQRFRQPMLKMRPKTATLRDMSSKGSRALKPTKSGF